MSNINSVLIFDVESFSTPNNSVSIISSQFTDRILSAQIRECWNMFSSKAENLTWPEIYVFVGVLGWKRLGHANEETERERERKQS